VIYSVQFESAAERELVRLPDHVLNRVDAKILALREDPRPNGCLKLQGQEGPGWRVRVGEYRILYRIDDDAHVVSIYRIRPRGSAYRP
jgi:mRNA interferase RelE/StbE